MHLHTSLVELLAAARQQDRHVQFIDGESDESRISFDSIWTRATRLLGALQSKGMTAGDELVIFSKSNEEFVIAFWAAILGGIVPVPVAVGISDEHRLKLFRILQQMRRGSLYTDAALLSRLKSFAIEQHMSEVTTKLDTDTILMGDIEGGGEGRIASVKAGDIAFI
ncbi:MAG: AMP-binding protein, partial [Woeseiaceae bacterium]